MLFTKAKIATALILLVSIVVTGSGLLLAPLAAHPEGSESQAERQPAVPAKDEQAEPIEVKGRVHDPDSKPVAGARVFLWASGKAGPEVKTGADGHFQLQLGPGQINSGARLIAAADGFGPDWVDVKGKETAADITLQLAADDLPILGRVVDLEGRPVAGAAVKVQSLRKPGEKGLSWWLEQKEKGRTYDLPRLAGEALPVPTRVTTGQDGRFRLSGFGRERVVGFHVQGPGIQQMEFWVVTRSEVSAKLRKGFYGTYPTSFELLVGPGRAIVGTIREKGTGQPIAGATVGSVYYGNIYVKTDKNGRYRIEGVTKHEKYAVSAGGKHPYFNSTKLDVPDEPGLEPITVDFDLEKGIVIRGRLTEKGGGNPVPGRISYQPAADNPHLKDYSHFGKPQIYVNREGEVAADGSFAILAIPGPGYVCVRANDTGRYLRKTPEGLQLGNVVREQYHAIVPIQLAADGSQPAACDISLEAGKALDGKLLDADGKPVPGALAAGLGPVSVGMLRDQQGLDGPEFKVSGLDAGSRLLFFFHAEKRLAKITSVRGEDPSPVTVRLDPLGSVAGRVLDAGGKPRTDVKVVVSLTRKLGLFGKELPLDLLLDYPSWNKLLTREVATGADGRFQLDDLVPGLKYHLEWGDGGRQSGLSRDEITVEPGKTTAVGDLTPPAQAKEAGGK